MAGDQPLGGLGPPAARQHAERGQAQRGGGLKAELVHPRLPARDHHRPAGAADQVEQPALVARVAAAPGHPAEHAVEVLLRVGPRCWRLQRRGRGGGRGRVRRLDAAVLEPRGQVGAGVGVAGAEVVPAGRAGRDRQLVPGPRGRLPHQHRRGAAGGHQLHRARQAGCAEVAGQVAGCGQAAAAELGQPPDDPPHPPAARQLAEARKRRAARGQAVAEQHRQPPGAPAGHVHRQRRVCEVPRRGDQHVAAWPAVRRVVGGGRLTHGDGHDLAALRRDQAHRQPLAWRAADRRGGDQHLPERVERAVGRLQRRVARTDRAEPAQLQPAGPADLPAGHRRQGVADRPAGAPAFLPVGGQLGRCGQQPPPVPVPAHPGRQAVTVEQLAAADQRRGHDQVPGGLLEPGDRAAAARARRRRAHPCGRASSQAAPPTTKPSSSTSSAARSLIREARTIAVRLSRTSSRSLSIASGSRKSAVVLQ